MKYKQCDICKANRFASAVMNIGPNKDVKLQRMHLKNGVHLFILVYIRVLLSKCRNSISPVSHLLQFTPKDCK